MWFGWSSSYLCPYYCTVLKHIHHITSSFYYLTVLLLLLLISLRLQTRCEEFASPRRCRRDSLTVACVMRLPMSFVYLFCTQGSMRCKAPTQKPQLQRKSTFSLSPATVSLRELAIWLWEQHESRGRRWGCVALCVMRKAWRRVFLEDGGHCCWFVLACVCVCVNREMSGRSPLLPVMLRQH